MYIYVYIYIYVYVYIHIHVYMYTYICIYLLSSPSSRIFSPSLLCRWLDKITALTDGSGPQDPWNVYLAGRQRRARTFRDYAESTERIIQELRLRTNCVQVYCAAHNCVSKDEMQ